jgi:UDP-N-acetylmuramoyl-L-alanyl-D-glutamate--2,6-diaminopimelate ligase
VLVEAWGKPIRVRLPLIGAFQAMNVMTAAGLAIASGDEPDAVFAVLPELTGVRGRMQLAGRARQRRAGLRRLRPYARRAGTALKALRPHVLGRLTWSSARAATATGASAR